MSGEGRHVTGSVVLREQHIILAEEKINPNNTLAVAFYSLS